MGLILMIKKITGDFTTVYDVGTYPSFITFKPGAGII